MALSQALESLIEQGKDNPLLRLGLANAYQREGQLEQALTACKAALAQQGDYLDVILLQSQLLQQLGQVDNAKACAQHGLAQAQQQNDVLMLEAFKQLSA